MDFLAEMEKAAFFFDGALVVSGSRNPAWGVTEAFTLIELPDAGRRESGAGSTRIDWILPVLKPRAMKE